MQPAFLEMTTPRPKGSPDASMGGLSLSAHALACVWGGRRPVLPVEGGGRVGEKLCPGRPGGAWDPVGAARVQQGLPWHGSGSRVLDSPVQELHYYYGTMCILCMGTLLLLHYGTMGLLGLDMRRWTLEYGRFMAPDLVSRLERERGGVDDDNVRQIRMGRYMYGSRAYLCSKAGLTTRHDRAFQSCQGDICLLLVDMTRHGTLQFYFPPDCVPQQSLGRQAWFVGSNILPPQRDGPHQSHHREREKRTGEASF